MTTTHQHEGESQGRQGQLALPPLTVLVGDAGGPDGDDWIARQAS